jgi:hypothetical protein
MKRVYITLVFLLVLLAGMAYLYFSNLNSSRTNPDLSLKYAAQNSGLIFSFQQSQSVVDILKGENLFNHLIGREKSDLLAQLNAKIFTTGILSSLVENQTVYIGILPGAQKNVDLLFSIQLRNQVNSRTLVQTLQKAGIKMRDLNGCYEVQLPGTQVLYLAYEKEVILLSTRKNILRSAFNKPDVEEEKFISFIKKNDRLTQNSLANLYINYKRLPDLLKAIIPTERSNAPWLFDCDDSFGHLSYNFSKEKILFTGETSINDKRNYLKLFQALNVEKVQVDRTLPSNTSNYALFCSGIYINWQKKLNNWFVQKKEYKDIQTRKAQINTAYHLNLDGLIPPYLGSQFVSFQLSDGQNLAAISLTNGDKLSQLLLDLSDVYGGNDGKIRLFKEPDILYCYFGEALKKFKRPYYVIDNNTLFVASSAAPLSTLLKMYEGDKLLINEEAYTRIFEQLSNSANVQFYFNKDKSGDLIAKNLYSSYDTSLLDPQGLKNFNTFVYQLTGDEDSFQTSIFLNENSISEKASTPKRAD